MATLTASDAQRDMAREIAQRYYLRFGEFWWYDDDKVLDVCDLFAYDKKNPETGDRRFDAIRMGAIYEAPMDHLSRKCNLPVERVERMIELMRLGGRVKDCDEYEKYGDCTRIWSDYYGRYVLCDLDGNYIFDDEGWQ